MGTRKITDVETRKSWCDSIEICNINISAKLNVARSPSITNKEIGC